MSSSETKAVLLVTNVFQLLCLFLFLQREAALKDHSPLGAETLLK